MSRRSSLLAGALLALAAFAGLAAHTRASSASFTTSSSSVITASVDSVTNWLYLYSQDPVTGTDPDGQNGYAARRGLNGAPGPPAASGVSDTLTVDMGDFPDSNSRYSFPCLFTIRAPDAFPGGFAGPVTVTLTLLPDPATGDAMLQNGTLTPFGQAGGGGTTVPIAPAAKYQLNLSVRARKRFQLGRVYFPRVRLALAIGGVADSFSYEIPLQVTDAGGS